MIKLNAPSTSVFFGRVLSFWGQGACCLLWEALWLGVRVAQLVLSLVRGKLLPSLTDRCSDLAKVTPVAGALELL